VLETMNPTKEEAQITYKGWTGTSVLSRNNSDTLDVHQDKSIWRQDGGKIVEP